MKCNKCGEEGHSASWCPQWRMGSTAASCRDEPNVANTIKIMANIESDMANNEIPESTLRVTSTDASSTYRYRDAESRRLYQREYMRKRRKV